MATSITDTALGGLGLQAYISTADVTTYLTATSALGVKWADATTDAEKDKALMNAITDVEMLPFPGARLFAWQVHNLPTDAICDYTYISPNADSTTQIIKVSLAASSYKYVGGSVIISEIYHASEGIARRINTLVYDSSTGVSTITLASVLPISAVGLQTILLEPLPIQIRRAIAMQAAHRVDFVDNNAELLASQGRTTVDGMAGMGGALTDRGPRMRWHDEAWRTIQPYLAKSFAIARA